MSYNVFQKGGGDKKGMKVNDIAKMLGVSRGTVWRWKKAGILDKKIEEHKEQTALIREIETADLLNIIFQQLGDLTKTVKNIENMSQNVLNMLQQVLQISQGIIDRSQNVSNMSYNVLRDNDVPQDLLPATLVADILRVNRRSFNDWLLAGKVKSIKVGGRNFIPRDEALRIIFKQVYDEVNSKTNANDSVSIKDFKNELKKRIQLSEEEINKKLLDLHSKGVLSLQTVDGPEKLTEEEKKALIVFDEKNLFFITWKGSDERWKNRS